MARRRMLEGFPGGAAGLVGGTLAVAGGLAVLAMAIPDDPPPAAATASASGPAVDAALRARVGRELSAADRGAMERLVREGFPAAATERARVVGFYFDGEPTLCGETDPVRIGRGSRRFIARNGHVLVEGDVSAADFAMFWQVCAAAGV